MTTTTEQLAHASAERIATARVDSSGRAYAGSMLQTQLYVNDPHRRATLNRTILQALPDLADLEPEFNWRSPLQDDHYREYWDAAFLRRLGFSELAGQLREWWPRGGPHWDALARLEFADTSAGVLLVESKSYPGEMYDETGCAAKSDRSLAKIEAAFAATQEWLGVSKPIETWMRPLYQTANRLAMLHWLMRKLHGRAWLVYLCFLKDTTHPSERGYARQEWEQALTTAHHSLGINRAISNYAPVFIEAANT